MAGKLGKLAAGLVIGAALVVSAPAQADDYDSQRSGHPVRIAAYILHPIGVIIDTLIFKPAHWLGHREPFQTLFGHED